MTTRDYYEVLGVQPLSDGATVDQAYWHLAKAYQTQTMADPRARQLLDELNEAYGILGTPRLRDDYDALRVTTALAAKPRTSRKVDAPGRSSWLRPPWNFFKKGAAPGSAPRLGRDPSVRKTAEAAHGDGGSPKRQQKSDVSELRDSTSRMLERWRTNTGAQHSDDTSTPDMTLVDIFKTEQELSVQGDPLTAVIDVLKAPKDVIPVRSR